MKIGIEIKKHSELTNEETYLLVGIKNQHWHYKNEEHLRWLKENIMPDDYHLFVWGGNTLLAYLNIVHVDVIIDQKTYGMLGIGNVCVEQEKKGFGKGAVVMAAANAFVKEMNSCGILLCRETLVSFYSKSNWKTISPTEIRIKNKPFQECIMVYDPFRCLPLNIRRVCMMRKF